MSSRSAKYPCSWDAYIGSSSFFNVFDSDCIATMMKSMNISTTLKEPWRTTTMRVSNNNNNNNNNKTSLSKRLLLLVQSLFWPIWQSMFAGYLTIVTSVAENIPWLAIKLTPLSYPGLDQPSTLRFFDMAMETYPFTDDVWWFLSIKIVMFYSCMTAKTWENQNVISLFSIQFHWITMFDARSLKIRHVEMSMSGFLRGPTGNWQLTVTLPWKVVSNAPAAAVQQQGAATASSTWGATVGWAQRRTWMVFGVENPLNQRVIFLLEYSHGNPHKSAARHAAIWCLEELFIKLE